MAKVNCSAEPRSNEGRENNLPAELKARVEDAIDGMCANIEVERLSMGAQLRSGRFSGEIEVLRRPLQGLERREGSLIEAAIDYGLRMSPRLHVMGRMKVPVWESSKQIWRQNRLTDVTPAIRAPLEGLPCGTVELDNVVLDELNRDVTAVEVKRSTTGVGAATEENLGAATLTLRHELLSRGCTVGRITPCLVVWWSDDAAHVTRETIDDVFGVPIRDLVDQTIRCFREGATTCTRDLVCRALERDDVGPTESEPTALTSIADALATVYWARRGRARAA